MQLEERDGEVSSKRGVELKAEKSANSRRAVTKYLVASAEKALKLHDVQTPPLFRRTFTTPCEINLMKKAQSVILTEIILVYSGQPALHATRVLLQPLLT